MGIGDYLEVNERLAETVFSTDMAGRPVYLGADDDIFAKALSELGADGTRSSELLCAVTRATLHIDDAGISPFRWYVEKLRRTTSDRLETPPTIGLLSVLSIAADQMNAGDGMASHNYYGRLMNLLGVPKDRRQRVQMDYQKHSEELWASLNDWLVAWEGERGMPTAYSVGFRHVGLPMSQALVREQDRIHLVRIFRAEGLPPGFQMTPRDMEEIMEGWVTKHPSPLSNTFRMLWGNPTAREGMLGVACLELEAWDGTGFGDAEQLQAAVRSFGDVRLVASLRTFPARSVELNLSIPLLGGMAVPLFVSSGDETIELPVGPGPAGSARLSDPAELDQQSLLADEILGTIGEGGRSVARRPRRVVPLRWHDIQSCFVETERVERGERSIVIAAEATKIKIERYLAQVARPGFKSVDSVPGLPSGWVLFEDVQVMGTADGIVHMDLQPLVPRAQTSLAFSGGLSLPGKLRKWSSLVPPEVHAIAAGASNLEVRFDRGTVMGDLVESLKFEGEAAVVSIADLILGDGEYLVSLYVDGAKKSASTALLRLRSANTPVSASAIDGGRIVHVPESSPLWPVSAVERGEATSWVDGVLAEGLGVSLIENLTLPQFTPREKPVVAKVHRPPLRIGRQLGESSCMNTGAHRIELPMASAGRSVIGECTTCGIVRRYPTTAWGARKKKSVSTSKERPVAVHSAAELPPIQSQTSDSSRALFDSICHVGAGSENELGRIAAYVEATALFADSYLRNLESLAHIDVRRDDMMQPLEWGINFPVLVPIAEGEWFLSGRTSESMMRDLDEAVSVAGGSLITGVDGSMKSVVVRGVIELSQLAAVVDLHGLHLLDTNPALEIALALPPITSLEPCLSRRAIPAYRTLERWDTASASWFESNSMLAKGAYRLTNYSRVYLLRSERDIAGGTIAIANAQLVKHIANAWAGDSLAGYHESSGSLLVPQGADLPGLYARAAVVCSGRLPAANGSVLQYFDVDRDVASVLIDKLTR